MGSDRRIQKKAHGPDHGQRKRRYTWGCNPKRHGAKATTTKDVCVLMPFLPKICYYVNCFRTCQPPTRVWETISRAGWTSSADAADNPLFAHMPYLWNLRPEHQRIWANPKQAQTIQWPRVPPNGMACTVTTNNQFQLACLLQLSAWKLSAPAAVAAKASAAVIVAAAGLLFAAVTSPPAVACTKTASTKSAPGRQTPWLWRTS